MSEMVNGNTRSANKWWETASIYQIYPRSFADSNGDGVGDLQGIRSRIPHLTDLGVDAVWMSPFYPNGGADGGYDVADYMDVAPEFGTLDDFDELLRDLHTAGIRLIVDIVPNHASTLHPLFQAALDAGPRSAERQLFHFREPRVRESEANEPPNNWQSHFGGAAWTQVADGEWYLHLFDRGQPDFNWDNPQVRAYFDQVLRFWLDRGVDGFRVDVAHLLCKDPALPDWGGPANGSQHPDFPTQDSPMFGRTEVHDVFRQWRRILEEYSEDSARERMLCGEVCVDPLSWQAQWARADEMHTVFNFSLLNLPFKATEWKETIAESLNAFGAVGAPCTWVLSNHDVVRHATRFAYTDGNPKLGDGIGPEDPQPDYELGIRRARATTAVLGALPGSVYFYQGEELGLADHTTLPHSYRIDPIFSRTRGERIGRDGARVPLPWNHSEPGLGFSDTGRTWLPQPEEFQSLAADLQVEVEGSTLEFYRMLLARRRTVLCPNRVLRFLNLADELEHVLAFSVGGVDEASIIVLMNTSDLPVNLADAVDFKEVVLSSWLNALEDNYLMPNSTVWLRV